MNTLPLTNLVSVNNHPMERLQKMREQHPEQSVVPMRFDNFLAGRIQGNICFRRIKYACLLGRYYWIRNRYETSDDHGFNLPDQSSESKFTSYEPGDDEKHLTLMRIDGHLGSKTDFADIGVGLGLELECLESFLVNSVRDETQSKYRLRQPSRKAKKKVELQVVEVQEVSIPLLETGIPRQRKRAKGASIPTQNYEAPLATATPVFIQELFHEVASMSPSATAEPTKVAKKAPRAAAKPAAPKARKSASPRPKKAKTEDK